MDCCTDGRYAEVTLMFPAQVSKTEGIVNNTVGYYIDQDPSPMLIVLENEKKAEGWSKRRLTPMLTDTPCLIGKVQDSRKRDSGSTLFYKEFPGGYLSIVGAGAEGDLSSYPIRVVLMDELDKYLAIS